MSARDADLLVKVRLANLWEMPAGQMAGERSASVKVQEAGRTMMNDHTLLNVEVERLAGLYGLQLPSAPNDMQKSWLTEMAQASGAQFDSVFAMRLRAAHGLIFPVVDFAALYAPTPLMVMSDSDGGTMVVALALAPPVVAIAIFVLWLAVGRNRRRPGGGRPNWSYTPEDDDDRQPGRTRFLADSEPTR
ncbi:hypothetical protein JOF56_008774 [Kibdelosporangium banguiense]|uniref:DUF4142 domain-containing protein n=1 Tax=Kibdelosporangium banguiense TaxID=1365924 RepID=A0ABS4TWM9_9PSEU|nr:DUF4142 domain-containing protein [Kibdelosporangium banguiense]MBP2328389.1 hypothetical protein [Kibdelosporangium banguiense]